MLQSFSTSTQKSAQRRRSTVLLAKTAENVESLIESADNHTYQQLFVLPIESLASPLDYVEYTSVVVLDTGVVVPETIGASSLFLQKQANELQEHQLTVYWQGIDGRHSLTQLLSDPEVQAILDTALDSSNPPSTMPKVLIQRILHHYHCSYLNVSTLVAQVNDANTLSLYWFTGQRIRCKNLSDEDKQVAEWIKALSVDTQTRITDMAMINQLVKKYECTTADENLPSPPNFRHFNAVQLAYIYNHNHLSSELYEDLKSIAEQMIDSFSRAHVVTEKYLHNIAPLAMFNDEKIVHELIGAIITKIRDEPLISQEKVDALRMIIEYANKDLLKPDDIMEVLSLLAERLGKMKNASPETLGTGLASLNALLDAAMTVDVPKADPEKLASVTNYLEELVTTDEPFHKVAAEYAQQAFRRVTEQKTDWEQGLSASYDLVNGVVQLGFAVLDKSPTDIIDSVIAIYGAAQGIQGAMKGAQYPWFPHVRTLKLMGQYDADKFFSYLDELIGEKRQQSSRFSSDPFPKPFVVSLIEILDRMVHDLSLTDMVELTIKGNRRLLPAREIPFVYYARIFMHPDLYGSDRDVRDLVLQKLYAACSVPEPVLQRAAKNAAQDIFAYVERRRKDILNYWGHEYQLVSTYWGSSTLISLQASDANFPYLPQTPDLVDEYVGEAMRHKLPLLYAIEGMWYESYQTLNNTSLKEDMDTYIPVNATQSGKKDELFDLYKRVREFLNTDERVVLIHGNAGSGKSLFGRYLQHSLWNEYQHRTAWIPIFVSLPGLKDPIRDAIRGTLLNEGFSDAQIRQLKNLRAKILFILDGFDEIQAKDNLYQSNKFSEWECKVIVTARTEYLLGLGNYYQYFSNSSGDQLRELYIRPFNQEQRQSFFKKMIEKGLTIWKEEQKYEDEIKKTPGLSELITTPFMLRIVVEILPALVEEGIQDQQITRAFIYEVFTEREFEENKHKLRLLANQITIPKNFDEVLSFRKFSMSLAANMFVKAVNSVFDRGDDFRFSNEINDYWDQFFGSHSHSLIASRYGAPLIRVGRQQSFRHKSLLEYFAAKMIMHELYHVYKNQESLLISHCFNQRPIHEEPSVLDFMKDMMKTMPELEEELWKILEQSKSEENIAIAVGNAMTVLVALGRSFADKNLAGIHSRGAKVDNGNFTRTNFQAAHFRDTSWDGACLNEADFTDVVFENNLIEERAALVPSVPDALSNFWVIDKYHLVIATNTGGTFFWHHGELILSRLDIVNAVFKISPDQRWFLFKEPRKILLFNAQTLINHQTKPIEELEFNMKGGGPRGASASPSAILMNKKIVILSAGSIYIYALDNFATEEANVSYGPNFYPRSFNDGLILLDEERYIVNHNNYFCKNEITKVQYNQSQFKWIKSCFLNCSQMSRVGQFNYFLIKRQNGCLELRSTDTLERVSFGMLNDLKIDAYVTSPTGHYLIIKNGAQVSVFILDHNEGINAQLLYKLDGVTNELHVKQFSPDERYVAWAFGAEVKLIKTTEEKVLQRMQVLGGGSVLGVQFDSGEHEDNLLIRQDGNDELLRRRVDVDEQYEEKHQNKEFISQELSALGAKFFNIQGLSAEDHQLMQERGGLFRTEQFLIDEYNAAIGDLPKRLKTLLEAARNRYQRFMSTVEWEKNLTIDESQTSLVHYLISCDRYDGGYIDYLLFLKTLGVRLDQSTSFGMTTLCLAARKGLPKLCLFLIEQNIKVNKEDDAGFDLFDVVHALSEAASSGHIEVVKVLLGETAINQRATYLCEPLSMAAKNGHVEVMKLLLAIEGIPVTSSHRYSDTPLYLAAQNGHVEVVKLLLAAGAEVDDRSLGKASANGHVDVVKLLLAGVAINQARTASYCLFCAVQNGHIEVVKTLLAVEGILLDHTDNQFGCTAMHMAAENGYVKIIKVLLAAGAWVDCYDLYIASENGHVDVVQMLLAIEGIAVNQANNNSGLTPLGIASKNGHIEVVKLLLAVEGIAVNQADNYGCTALGIASINGHVEVVKLLLAVEGIAVNQDYGSNPLFLAAQSDRVDLLKMLLGIEAFVVAVNQADNEGFTALGIASKNGHIEVVKLLLAVEGIAVNQADNYGWTPLISAAARGHDKVCELLLTKMTYINSFPSTLHEDNQGLGIPHFAAVNGHLSCLKLFMDQYSVPVDIVCSARVTPLQLAILNGQENSILDFLVNKGADLSQKLAGIGVGTLAKIRGVSSQIEYLEKYGCYFESEDLKHCSYHPFLLWDTSWKVILTNLKGLGMDFSAPDEDGKTWLQIAIEDDGRIDRIEGLLEFDADPEIKNKDGKNAFDLALEKFDPEDEITILLQEAITRNQHTKQLHLSVQAGDIESVRAVIHNVHINRLNDEGYSALCIAAMKGYLDIVALLLENKADVDTPNEDGFTALYIAAERGDLALVALLLENGASINQANNLGLTPLHIAIDNGQLEAAKRLLAQGADPDIKTEEGNSAIARAMAVFGMDHELVALMQKKIIEETESPHLLTTNTSTLFSVANTSVDEQEEKRANVKTESSALSVDALSW